MDIKESLEASARIENTFNSLVKVVDKQQEEICNLKRQIAKLQDKILELELRPPPEGGTLYQDAKESFEHVGLKKMIIIL